MMVKETITCLDGLFLVSVAILIITMLLIK